jgi:hypothetical protein
MVKLWTSHVAFCISSEELTSSFLRKLVILFTILLTTAFTTSSVLGTPYVRHHAKHFLVRMYHFLKYIFVKNTFWHSFNWHIWCICIWCNYWSIGFVSTTLLFIFYLSHLFYVPFSLISCFPLDWSNIFIIVYFLAFLVMHLLIFSGFYRNYNMYL